jgi:hypothetical protein
MVMLVKLRQFAKAKEPIEVMEGGSVTLFKLLQPVKVEPLIAVIEDGISMTVKLLQFSKAREPMEATEAGKVMLARLLQPLKA